MNQADIEKYAFLYFCGEKDRDILLENRKMTSVMYRLLVSNFVSFFAPFLLILQLNQDKIGCKSEAKRNKKEEAEYESGRY